MSHWASFENFFYSRTASWCRRGLLLLGVGGVGGDYYLTHYYEAFQRSEGELYIVDWSGIGRPCCQMLLIPNNRFTNYSPWTPKNGEIVIARTLPNEPRFLQLINGRFVERSTCGVELMRPVVDSVKGAHEG